MPRSTAHFSSVVVELFARMRSSVDTFTPRRRDLSCQGTSRSSFPRERWPNSDQALTVDFSSSKGGDRCCKALGVEPKCKA